MCWLSFVISLVDILGKPLAGFLLLFSYYFGAVKKMFFEFLL